MKHSWILLLLFFSCTKYFVYENQKKQKINVVSFIKANDSVSVLVTKAIFEENKDLDDTIFIKNAKVFLIEDNNRIIQLYYDTLYETIYNKKGYYKSSDFVCSEYKKYKLKVFVEGYDTVFAETFIPQIVKIDSTKNKINKTTEINGNFYNFSTFIFFKDEMNKNNFYNFDTRENFICRDPVVETRDNNGIYNTYINYGNFVNKCIFSDSLFKNSNYLFNINFKFTEGYLTNYFSDTILFIPLVLENLSKDAYLFYKTIFLYRKTIFNPLTEPVQIYSNVKNGTGIFAGYSSYTDTLVITKEMLNLK